MYSIETALGGKKKIGEHKAGLDEVILKGLPVEAANYFKQLLKLTDKEFAQVLGMSERSFHRQKQSVKRLPVNASDRLYRHARIFSLAVAVLGSEESARKWLMAPHFSLNGRSPMEVIATDAGAKKVELILGRIKYGVAL